MRKTINIGDLGTIITGKTPPTTNKNYLSRYDSLIENYQKQIKLLEEAAQRLYKEWFVDLHFPGHENTNIIDGVPEGWEKKKVGDITPIITGKKDANFGTPDGEYPFFTCSQEPIKAPSFSFDCAAVLLASNGDFNVKLYRGRFEAYQRTYVLSPYIDSHLYLLFYTISANMSKLAAGSSGSTIKFLTKGMIDGINLNVPNDEILRSFNKKVEPIQSSRESLQSQLRLLTEARDRLLPM
ncbi:MAG: restriction endonuclease subunit S [Bacteroidales bacterium]|nr:restriction endonuclease subunit S [Bacteroidales bacterium]